jgi:hypothetical protein
MFTQGRFASTIVIAAMVICTTAAKAADNTRYVSVTGNNANACTLAAPCRSLQRGINMTPAGGELQILDSGSYGVNANIAKSLTINGNGHTVYLGEPITINGADTVVALRGLALDGQGTVVNGISVVNAAAVHIERCIVHGFADTGINATATGVVLNILDSISRDNGNLGFNIVSAGAAQVTIDNSRFENNSGAGVGIQSGARATISRSIATGNLHGIFAQGGVITVMSSTSAYNSSVGFGASGGGTVTIESSISHDNNLAGVLTNPGNTIRISNSTITDNPTGVQNNGTVETRQNNTIRGNTANLAGNALSAITGL